MKKTNKSARLLISFNLCVLALQLSGTKAMPINEESMKFDELSSGQHGNDNKYDDLFGGESDKGSGDSATLGKSGSSIQSSLLNDKQVDKLIQAEDLGLASGLPDSETSGKMPNIVPDFKESSEGEPDVIFSPNDSSKNQELTEDNTMESEGKDREKVGSADGIAAGGAQFADSTETAPKEPVKNIPLTTAAKPEVGTNTGPQEAQSFSNTNSKPVVPQPQTPMDINTQADSTAMAQPEVTMNATPDQSQSYSQAQASAQQEVQPAVTAYNEGAAQTADASALQQTFSDAALQHADYQSPAISAFNGQQPAETTNNAAAAQQWDSAASVPPQGAQQYNDAATPTQQAAQPINTDSSTTEGKSHTIQLDEERYRTLICQNGKDTISCPPNKQISVRNAEYGSMGASACLGRQFSPSPICKTPGAFEIVKSNCDDMEDCELMANDDLFGDECETDKKYLDLEYACVPNPSPASLFQGSFPPQAMYPVQQPGQAAVPQFMYPAPQPAYPPSAYQGYPEEQGQEEQQDYGQEQQQDYGQEQQQQQVAPIPPAPELPELMSTLLDMTKKSQANRQQQCATQCNTCNLCAATPVCHPCPVCKSAACTSSASLPYIPKGLRPLWELWNEKTADMNKMEMSALIISPVPKLPPTKKSSSLTESEGSGDVNSDKRSHVKSTKHDVSKSSRKTKDISKHSASKTIKSHKVSKKSPKSGSKGKRS